jgi:AraC-like DNA-binding protein
VAFDIQPTEPTPDSTVSIQVLRAIADAAVRAGVSRTALVGDSLVPAHTWTSSDARVPRTALNRLCTNVAAITGDPAFGLRWKDLHDTHALNPVADLIVHAADLREGLDSLSRFQRLLSDQSNLTIIESENHVVVRCTGLQGDGREPARFITEMLLGSVLKLLVTFVPHASPLWVNFDYPAPSYRAEYTCTFMGQEHFDQPHSELAFERALLSVPSPHGDKDLHGALRSIAEQRLLRMLQCTPYALRVRDHLVASGHAHRVSMAAVARGLGLSVRSLRRRLEAEGTSYKNVVNESLGILAKQLIRHSSGSVQEIAFEMGFADTSSFHRAFKRWTGMTPRTYRTELNGPTLTYAELA